MLSGIFDTYVTFICKWRDSLRINYGLQGKFLLRVRALRPNARIHCALYFIIKFIITVQINCDRLLVEAICRQGRPKRVRFHYLRKTPLHGARCRDRHNVKAGRELSAGQRNQPQFDISFRWVAFVGNPMRGVEGRKRLRQLEGMFTDDMRHSLSDRL